VSDVLVLAVIGISTSRCSVSQEWVVAEGRIRLTHLMFAACGVWTVTLPPYPTDAGAPWMTGRARVMYDGL
jgi:hypothetical protein